MEEGLAAIRSVPQRATCELWLKTLVIFITRPAEAWTKSLEIIMDIHVHYELNAEARKQKFFRVGKDFWNKGTFINILFVTHKG